MFSSIVKAGMRAITPKGKLQEEASGEGTSKKQKADDFKNNNNNNNNTSCPYPTTPNNPLGKLSQASVPTPSTVSTVDITANTTLESITFDAGNEHSIKNDSTDGVKKSNREDGKQEECKTSCKSKNSSSSSHKETKPNTTMPTHAAALWGVLDTQLRSNIGASVRCGICLSTVRDPVRTPCSHVFCRGCITGYLRASSANSCPECKAPCTRRSLETFSEMDEMADAYKGLLRAFGLAPGIYTPEITTMTQKVVSSYNNDENDDEGLTEEESRRARLDRLCVSATYQQKALPVCSAQNTCSKLQIEENEQVVTANFKACFGRGFENDDETEIETMQELLEARILSARLLGNDSEGSDSRVETKPEAAAAKSLSQACCPLPNTQDVQEQAREQLEADREMQESMEAAEREKEKETKPELFVDEDEDEAFFTLKRKKKDSAHDPFALPAQDEPSPPLFARAETNNGRAFKSFSRRDQSLERPSFGGDGGEALSPIDHETSYWTVDKGEIPPANSKKKGSSSSASSSASSSSLGMTHVTGMLEDSRGGLHMLPVSCGNNHERRHENAESEYFDHDDSDDKTIAMTLDDSPTSSRNSEGGKDSNDGTGNSTGRESNQESQTPDSTKSNSSSRDNAASGDHFPLTYDPIGNPMEITEEYHETTKTEISNAANLPAELEQEEEEELATQKALFPAKDDGDDAASKEIGKRNKRNRKASRKAVTQQKKASNNSGPDSETSQPSRDNAEEECFPNGTIVRVQARTWPGVNKQGGVGRITGQNSDGTYNVAYVLGGKESRIDAVFVSREDQGESENGNHGSNGAGRKRRRRAKDSLPEELLKQLAAEGFDIPGVKSKAKKEPKPKAASAALADTTNKARAKAGSKQKRAAGRAISTHAEEASSTAISRPKSQASGRRNQNASRQEVKASSTTGRRRKRAKEQAVENLPTTVKRTKQPAGTKAKAGRKMVTWSTSNETSSKRTTRKKPALQFADQNRTETNHEATFEIVDASYKEQLEKAISNGKVVVVSSNLSEADKAIFQSLRSGEVLTSTDTVDEHTHICIVPSMGSGDQNKSLASVRTLKVMMSALKGIPLVSPDWLRTCYLRKKILVPERFLRTMPTKNGLIKASGEALCGISKLAMARNNQTNLPFDKMCVCLCGSYKGETKKSLQDLLEAGGATILSSSSDVEARIQELIGTTSSESCSGRIAVVCGNLGRGGSTSSSGISLATQVKRQLRDFLKVQSRQEQGEDSNRNQTIVVDSQWVIESVTCAKPMPPNLFEPSILKDLWRLCL